VVMKYWKIIADNLSKAGWSWGLSQRLIPTGEQYSLAMRWQRKLAAPVKVKNKCAQTVLLMWESVTLVCDAAVKLNKLLFADSKLRCVADCCVTAIMIVEVVCRACCAKAVGVILYKLTQCFGFIRM
jgi:hypothetical protein